MEISVYKVVSDFSYLSPVGMIFFLRTFSFKARLMHDSLDPFVVDFVTSIHQFHVYSSDSISSFVAFENIFYLSR